MIVTDVLFAIGTGLLAIYMGVLIIDTRDRVKHIERKLDEMNEKKRRQA